MSAWSKQRPEPDADETSPERFPQGKTRDELDFWINAVGSPLLVVERRNLIARSGNRAAEMMFGMPAEELDGKPLTDLVGPEANQLLGQIWTNAPIGVTGEPFLVRAQVLGLERLLMVQVSKIVVEHEELRLFTLMDAPPQGSVALAGWQEKIIDMLNWLPFGFEIASYDEQIQFANSQFSALFGYSQDEIASIEDWWRLAYPDPEYRLFARSTWEGELAKARAEDREMTPFDLEVRTASGQDRTIQFRHRTVGNFNVNLYLDVTSERAAARELKRLSEIDPLTGIMNRRRFFEQAEKRYAGEADQSLAVLVLDLDEFKAINDRHGHTAGDVVLQEFALRCSDAIGEDGLFARFGGEEFVALLTDTPARPVAEAAEAIRAAIDGRDFAISGGSLHVTVSGGLATRCGDEELGQTISRADEALYAAKHAGRNRICC
jgi:diguanylate cyclase (GGDEF)-like protein